MILEYNYDKANEVYKQAILKMAPEQKVPEVENIIKSIEENLTIWKKVVNIKLSELNLNELNDDLLRKIFFEKNRLSFK